MSSRTRLFLGIAALFALGSNVQAQQAGDNIIGIGVARVAPSISLGSLNSVGPAATPFNAQTADATASAGNVNTLSLSYLHMFTDNVGVDLVAGVPPKLTLDVHLKTSDHPAAATADALTPAVVVKYLFNAAADKARPYVGLGVTYATFSGVTANGTDALVNALGGTSASLSSSWAPVYSAGLIYNINERFSVNASISYIPLKTTATFVGSGTTTTGSLELNPTDYIIRLGYKF